MKTCGLTLGKYAPFHKGHQLVIETALKEVDDLTLIIYDCPEITDVPLSVRSGWIRKLYPKVRIIESYEGPLEVGDTPKIKKMHEDYIIKTLGVSRITHFYCSEFYGEHMSKALNAVNRTVDKDRKKVGISGSEIRKDPFKHRAYLDTVVYRDLVTNVLFLGAPSSGKTTLAKALAKEMNTEWMPEYGREYWDKHQVNRRLTLVQLVEIAEGHLKREDEKLLHSDKYLCFLAVEYG